MMRKVWLPLLGLALAAAMLQPSGAAIYRYTYVDPKCDPTDIPCCGSNAWYRYGPSLLQPYNQGLGECMCATSAGAIVPCTYAGPAGGGVKGAISTGACCGWSSFKYQAYPCNGLPPCCPNGGVLDRTSQGAASNCRCIMQVNTATNTLTYAPCTFGPEADAKCCDPAWTGVWSKTTGSWYDSVAAQSYCPLCPHGTSQDPGLAGR